MNSRQTKSEWQVAKDEDEWHELAAMPLSICSLDQRRTWASRRRLSVFGLILGLAVCVAAVSGYLLWRKAETGLQVIESEIQETAYIEEWATHQRALRAAGVQTGSVLPMQYTTIEPKQMPTVEVEATILRGDQVMARVLVEQLTAHGEPIIYRETRFYRRTEYDWQRTSPDFDLLGPWHMLETKYFFILHPRFHAQMAKEAAPILDGQYEQMRQDYGLSPTVDGPKVTVEMADTNFPHMLTHLDTENRTIRVPVPALLPVPAQLEDTDIFLQSVSFRLAQLLHSEAAEERSGRWQVFSSYWQPLLDAINLWHLWQSSDQLLAWRYKSTAGSDVAVQNSRSDSANDNRGQPAGIASACIVYIVWDRYFVDMDAGNACSGSIMPPLEFAAIEVLDPQGLLTSSQPLSSGLPPLKSPQPWKETPFAQDQRSTVPYVSIVDHVVADYGREQLPVLFDALGNHLGWHELVPTVFEMPVTEFEKGWQTYREESGGDKASHSRGTN